jgi:hypothetical protein
MRSADGSNEAEGEENELDSAETGEEELDRAATGEDNLDSEEREDDRLDSAEREEDELDSATPGEEELDSEEVDEDEVGVDADRELAAFLAEPFVRCKGTSAVSSREDAEKEDVCEATGEAAARVGA